MNEEEKEIILNPGILRFIENIAGIYEAYGIPRIGGRIFGLCLSTTVPLSAEKMAELLQASRSSISTNIRGLIANGWVEKVTFPGDRTEYYRFCPMAWEHVLSHRKKGLLPLGRIAEAAQNDLPRFKEEDRFVYKGLKHLVDNIGDLDNRDLANYFRGTEIPVSEKRKKRVPDWFVNI